MRNAFYALTFTLLTAAQILAAPKLEVFPDAINLETARDHQAIVVQLTEDNGITRDVTADAQITLADPKLAKLENKNILKPAADGATTLTVAHAGQTVSVPLTVKSAAADRPISFKLDVMPIFMKSGCNC